MSLSFLPENIKRAVDNLNYNFLSEIRIRQGQPVIVEYKGEYKYLGYSGVSDDARRAVIPANVQFILNKATGGSVYSYAEQMKSGFLTVEHGVRIGLAGEYVTQNGSINAVNCVTSLNIRIPHDITGCSQLLCDKIFGENLHSTLIFSRPGLGKTTMLRDLARNLSQKYSSNILVFDERCEISAMDSSGNGFNLGQTVDVVRCSDKLSAIASAIRAMKPSIIITDELYGEKDVEAVKYAADCGICVIASSHIVERGLLKNMPFEYFVELIKIGQEPVIYDKNFNIVGGNSAFDLDRHTYFGE